jgi:hypothetical protein
MKKNINHSVTYSYKSEVPATEIHYDIMDKILGKNWENKAYSEIIIVPDKSSWANSVDAVPVEIDRVIKILTKLKKEGSNYIEIMYHCDHAGYYFNGIDIHRSTDEEVAKENERLEKFETAKKQAEIQLLEQKIDQIKKSLNK